MECVVVVEIKDATSGREEEIERLVSLYVYSNLYY